MDEVTFASGGVRCAAWHLPANGDAFEGPRGRPCVVLAHGFGGTRDSGLLPFAEAFADAGLHALVFDYRGFGASEGEPRQRISPRAQRNDYAAAIAAARRLPGIDPERIVAWGSSYSAGHVISIAAADGRLAAAIAQVPACDGIAELRELIRYAGLGQAVRLMWHGLRDVAGKLARRGRHRAPVVGPPSSLAFMSSPDSEPGYMAIAGPSFRNEVCAEIALAVPLNRPVRFAPQVGCPLLLQVADRDAIVSRAAAHRVAWKASGWAELRTYPIGHFEIYRGEPLERAIADQLHFLRRHVGVAGPVRVSARG